MQWVVAVAVAGVFWAWLRRTGVAPVRAEQTRSFGLRSQRGAAECPRMNAVLERRDAWLTLVVFVGAGLVALAWFPSPKGLLSDHGHGYQLAGAAEILAGRHPFVDFHDIYGPLPHYASALAHAAAGGRVGGELALVVLAMAAGCALFFRLLRRCGVGAGTALAATGVVVAVQPAAFRYHLFLLPVIFLAAAWRHAEAPTRGRRVALAATVTLAGLFRPDMGVFTWAAGVVLMATLGEGRRAAWREAAEFTGWVVAWALPWLGWLAAHGTLGEYLADSSAMALASNAGIARPFPGWSTEHGGLNAQNAKAVLFRLPGWLLVAALLGLWWRRRELAGAQRAKLWAVAALAAGTQLQAVSVVDWMHVRDPLPWRIFLLAWIAADGSGWRGAVARGVAAAVAMALAGAAAVRAPPGQCAPGAIAAKLRTYACGRAEFLERVAVERPSLRAPLYRYLRDHSAPDEGVFAVMEAPQTNFFAERRLAGGQLAIMPGYFASAADQRRLIARLRAERVAFVVLDHVVQEEYPDLMLAKFAPEFWAFLRDEFVEVERFGYARVLKPRWREAAGGGN